MGKRKLKRNRDVLPVLFFLLLFAVFVLVGQELDLLVSPGKLSLVHKNLSGMDNCSKCHTEGKKIESVKCLDCHKALNERIKKGRGYHRDKGENCSKCHPEHHGEDFKLIYWDLKKFRHDETGYPLTGLHRKVTDCDKCHETANKFPGKKAKTYFLKGYDCGACHKDVHKGKLGRDCDRCHQVENPFKNAVFNHDKSRFPLKGGHAKVSCEKCHRDKQWKGIRFSRCSNCHKDPHRPSFQKSCRSCHNENSWRVSSASFNHDGTRYPLRGRHRRLTCRQCHPKGNLKVKIAFARCTDCHKKDPHLGQFKNDCGECHVVNGFKRVIFQHNKSRYPLTGMHKKVTCVKCHFPAKNEKVIRYKPLEMDCAACHKDVHVKQFKVKCETCHTTAGFKGKYLKFDHQKDSDYKLVGKHLRLACSKCHRKTGKKIPGDRGRAVLYRPLPSKCADCHEDYHRGQVSRDCRRCHDETTFKPAVLFNHEKTGLPLKPLHEKVKCSVCHPLKVFRSAGKTYRLPDYKTMGRGCLDCHRNKKFDHNKTAYPLTGRHRKTKCSGCHNARTPNVGAKKGTAKDLYTCQYCHKTPHLGAKYKFECTKCHTTRTWRVDIW